MPTPRVPLLGAVLLLLAAAVAVALVPAGFSLDSRVVQEIRRVAVEDLGRAPMLLDDRNAAQAEALTMHAMSVAGTEGLASAVARDEMERAEELARATAGMYGEEPVVISSAGEPIVGPPPSADGFAALQRGESWTGYVFHAGVPRAVGLVALGTATDWSGAAGSTTAFDGEIASTLSGLARADVTILGPEGDLVASTLDSAAAVELSETVLRGDGWTVDEKVRGATLSSGEHWLAVGALPGAGTIVFSRAVADELAALPGVRRSYAFAGIMTLLLALGVGAVVALLLTRPVHGLAVAADRVAAGDFGAPVPGSRIEELDRLAGAFRSMRDALRHRLEELAEANQELEERQKRLASLQAELIRQDRLASSGRMVAELAHEIRNPVANVRNCLEVVRRGLPDDSEGSKFADMAIDELLRMHELAENLLDLNRPSDPGQISCRPLEVAHQVAALAGVGAGAIRVEVVADGAPAGVTGTIPPDALKQVLFNLVENAGEAGGVDARVVISVSNGDEVVRIVVDDEGPGIPDDALEHIFDPFFTTKGAVHGVGLGLFVAEGLVRRYGGRMDVANRTDTSGACFTVEIPRADEEVHA